ncbi:uncharacterized protein [Eurosta solidaginis]|uniref:uncharacterized protein n=1 Tax=Eurosta solidaginis TaxID=178769 RepID=UPI003530E0CA
MHLSLILRYICTFALLFSLVNAQDAASATTSSMLSSSSTPAASVTAATNAEVSSSNSSSPALQSSNAKKYFTADDLPVCKRSSADFNDCVKKLLQNSIQRIKNGDKELHIPVIDPLRLNRTTFQYSNGNIRGRITMRDGQTYGFSKTQVQKIDLKINGDRIKMKAHSFVPEIRVAGNYKADIYLNNVQMRPKGQFNVSLFNVNIDQLYEGGFYEADGYRFVRMDKFEADPKVSDFKFFANGLFPDPTLNELALNIVNQYWRQIFQVFLPETRQYWGPMLLQQLNDIMSVVPYDVFVVD